MEGCLSPIRAGQMRAGSNVTAIKEELLKAPPTSSGAEGLHSQEDGTRLVIALASNWLFASGDAVLTPDGITMLKRIGTVLGPHSDTFVQAAGHTDNPRPQQSASETLC